MNAGSTGRRAAIAVFLVCAVSAIAVGGYLVGHSNGEDLNAARSKGEAAGRIAGGKQGAKRGRVVGRPAGFKAGYETAYRKAFEDAGLDPPEDVKVPTQ